MTDHRRAAELELEAAAETFSDPDGDLAAIAQALIGIGHALLAQDHNRCTATRGHANGHHYPPEEHLVDTDRLKAEFGTVAPPNQPDTDTRCDATNTTGQCLDHLGHLGEHQWPAETCPHAALGRWDSDGLIHCLWCTEIREPA